LVWRVVKMYLVDLSPGYFYIKGSMDKQLLTIAELMEYLSISRTTVFKLMKDKRIKYAKVGRRVLFRKSDIDEFIQKCMVK
jgi:excisionase family DNA binding protein